MIDLRLLAHKVIDLSKYVARKRGTTAYYRGGRAKRTSTRQRAYLEQQRRELYYSVGWPRSRAIPRKGCFALSDIPNRKELAHG